MNETEASALKSRAVEIINELKHVNGAHERIYPPEIEAVLVLSGPGTYYNPLKHNQFGAYRRWIDQDRIRAGVAVGFAVGEGCTA